MKSAEDIGLKSNMDQRDYKNVEVTTRVEVSVSRRTIRERPLLFPLLILGSPILSTFLIWAAGNIRGIGVYIFFALIVATAYGALRFWCEEAFSQVMNGIQEGIEAIVLAVVGSSILFLIIGILFLPQARPESTPDLPTMDSLY